MRIVVYAVAVLAAAGIVVMISQPKDEANITQSVASQSTEVANQSVEPVTGETLVLHVPGMHCPHGCYPAVRDTLTSVPGVKKVELAKQTDENAIDNPRVTVIYADDFDSDAAINALAKAGFDGSSVDHTN